MGVCQSQCSESLSQQQQITLSLENSQTKLLKKQPENKRQWNSAQYNEDIKLKREYQPNRSHSLVEVQIENSKPQVGKSFSFDEFGDESPYNSFERDVNISQRRSKRGSLSQAFAVDLEIMRSDTNSFDSDDFESEEEDEIQRSEALANTVQRNAQYAAAVKAIAAEDFAEALRLLTQCLSLGEVQDRHSRAIYFKRGAVHIQLEQYQEAIQDFSSVLRLGAKKRLAAAAYINRAYCLEHLRHLQDALEDLTLALPCDPSCQQYIYNNRGVVLDALGRHQEALLDFDTAFAFDQSYLQALNNRALAYKRLGYYDAANLDLDLLISKQNGRNPLSYWSRGNLRVLQKQLYFAIEDFSAALALDATLQCALFNRAIIYLHLNNFLLAIKDLDDCLKLGGEVPPRVELLMRRAIAYEAVGRYEQALADLKACEIQEPQNLRIIGKRGNLLVKMRRYDEALKQFDLILFLDRDCTQAYCARGSVYLRLQKFDSAVSDANQALEIDYAYGKALCLRGIARLHLSQNTAAHQDLNTAIALNPQDKVALCNRAIANIALRNLLAAQRDLTLSLLIDPMYLLAREKMSYLKQMLQDTTD